MSFKETFTKEDKQSVLEYDDGAFYYFASTALFVTLAPTTVWFVRNRVLKADVPSTSGHSSRPVCAPSGAKLHKCGCSLCAAKRDRMARETPLWARVKANLPLGLTLIVGWALFLYLCFTSLTAMKTMASFDPYDVLQISMEATEKQIKKAFRTMSLKYHPDKNKNDPASAAKFLLIAKAYHTLTDENARKNFEKYGNPDGPGMMKVGIGLPSFLIGENSQIFIMAVFCIFLLIVVPALFISYYQRIREYSPSGLKVDTVRYFAGFMKENIMPHQLVVLIASSSECRSMPMRPTDEAELAVLTDKIKMPDPKVLGAPKLATVRKNMMLIFAHMQRQTEHLSPNLKADLNTILQQAIPMTKSMIDIAVLNNWHTTINSVLGLRRALLQALDVDKSPLLQLPHVTEQNCKTIQAEVPPASIQNKMALLRGYLKGALDHKAKALAGFSSEQINDLEELLHQVPDLHLTVSVATPDEAEICAGDIATCTIKCERKHLKANEAQGEIHAPYYPKTKHEEWFFFVTDTRNGQLLNFQTSKSPEREFELEVQFPVREPGLRKLHIRGHCDSYFGADTAAMAEFTAKLESEVNRKVFVHPDDLALDDQPSLIQQMIGHIDGGSSDSESDTQEGD